MQTEDNIANRIASNVTVDRCMSNRLYKTAIFVYDVFESARHESGISAMRKIFLYSCNC